MSDQILQTLLDLTTDTNRQARESDRKLDRVVSDMESIKTEVRTHKEAIDHLNAVVWRGSESHPSLTRGQSELTEKVEALTIAVNSISEEIDRRAGRLEDRMDNRSGLLWTLVVGLICALAGAIVAK
jgi:chromosome segregation ATPase